MMSINAPSGLTARPATAGRMTPVCLAVPVDGTRGNRVAAKATRKEMSVAAKMSATVAAPTPFDEYSFESIRESQISRAMTSRYFQVSKLPACILLLANAVGLHAKGVHAVLRVDAAAQRRVLLGKLWLRRFTLHTVGGVVKVACITSSISSMPTRCEFAGSGRVR